MQVDDAILARRSVRQFLDKAVDIHLINEAIDVARYAPSSTNTQPWEVAIVSGDTKAEIAKACTEAFMTKAEKTGDYLSYPKEWIEPFVGRRKQLGEDMYSALGIEYGDREGQRKQWIRNYESFDAPFVIFIFMDRVFDGGGYIDCGSFMQNLMLSLQAKGLATCAQASFVDYAGIIKERLGSKYQDKILIAGVAVGYEDNSHSVNTFTRVREPLSAFTEYFS